MLMAGIIIGLLVLVFLVALHELGHAIVAKRNGVEVEEFGIGFPPSAKKWQPKDSFLGKNVVFSLNWLPLGGFVRLRGEHDSATGKGSYGAASFWTKTKILLAGVAVNWLTAAVLFTILALVGLPKILPNQVVLPFDSRLEKSLVSVAKVADGSPAAQAGLKVDDQIKSIAGVNIDTPATLSAATKANSGKKVQVQYIRGGTEKSVEVTLADSKTAKNGGYLGVASRQSEKIYNTWSAPIAGVATAGQLSYETIKGVGSILVKSVGGFFGQFVGSDSSKQAARAGLKFVAENVAGPVGILGVLFPSVIHSGLTQVLLLAAIISLTLAVMNVLPIPALDGGRWFTMAIFRLFKKNLTKDREEKIQAFGMIVLMLLTILVTISDVGKIF